MASQVMPKPRFHAREARKNGACGTAALSVAPVRRRLRFRPTTMRITSGLTFLACFAVAAPAWSACKGESGARTAALVELYPSAGCSSCPPADRWLSGLPGRGYPPERVVPIALHVDYWDYIG